MPTYDYACRACGHRFEWFQSITSDVLEKCPECKKSKLERLIGAGAGLIFKGSGFYITDYRSDSYKKAAEKDHKPGKDPAPAQKDSSTKDSPTKDSPAKGAKGKNGPVIVPLVKDGDTYSVPAGRKLSESQQKAFRQGELYVNVNGIPHQALHPVNAPKEQFYDQLYKWFPDRTFPQALIVGAGSGTDVAITLARGADHVDAVEIDRAIQKLGIDYHPNHPYQDPRVTRYENDGRAFLRGADQEDQPQ